jgi:hypothetical protein
MDQKCCGTLSLYFLYCLDRGKDYYDTIFDMLKCSLATSLCADRHAALLLVLKGTCKLILIYTFVKYNTVLTIKMSFNNNILVCLDGSSFFPSNAVPPDVLTVSKANDLFVNEHGDDMKGILDMKNNKIINVAEPTNAKDVPTKEYVDDSVTTSHVTTKKYVDDSVNTTHETTKKYVDNSVTTAKKDVLGEVKQSLSNVWSLSNNVMTYNFVLLIPANAGIKEFQTETFNILIPDLDKLKHLTNTELQKRTTLQLTPIFFNYLNPYQEMVIMNISNFCHLKKSKLLSISIIISGIKEDDHGWSKEAIEGHLTVSIHKSDVINYSVLPLPALLGRGKVVISNN